MTEKFHPSFNDEKKSYKVLQKMLNVVNKLYQKTYTTCINLQGEYLKKFGFKTGDKVEILVTENQKKSLRFLTPLRNEI